jgi:hypothetical protein
LLPKPAQIELARSVGFTVLPTWYLRSAQDIRGLPANCYPLCVRPSTTEDRAALGSKARVVKDAATFVSLLESSTAARDPFVAQPLVEWPSLVVHGARAVSGELLALSAFLVPRTFQGFALALQPAPLEGSLAALCREFAERAGLTGVFHYDLLWSPTDGQTLFLEINMRLGGTTDKVARLGYDEPALLLETFGFTLRQIPAPRFGGRVANKRTLLKHIYHALRGQLSELDYPPGTRGRRVMDSLRDLWLARDSIFDWRDLRGSLWFRLRPPTEDAPGGGAR